MSFFFGKVVIVAGSSTAIGRAVATLFAGQGAKVAITGSNSEVLEETKRQCQAAGSADQGVFELMGDITEASFLDQIVPLTLANFGKIDVLVNIVDDTNAMRKPVIGMLKWESTFNLTIQLFARLTLLAIPHLEQTRGSIVNVSPNGHLNPLQSPSSLPSSPLDEITIQFASSLFWKGVRMNSVNYNSVRTNCKLETCDDKVIKQEIIECPTSPQAQPSITENAGKIILFIADRSRSAILVGQIISANGQLSSRSAIAPNL